MTMDKAIRSLAGAMVIALLAACGSSGSAPQAGPPQAQQPAASFATGGGGNGDGGQEQPPSQIRDEAKIIYTGSLDLVVSDLPAALSSAKAKIAALDGYIGSSQESNDGDSPTATVAFRIPSQNWEQGLVALRSLATKVVREQTQATEVTTQLIDLEARIRNLRSSETALQAIAANTARVQDLLDVQRELTNVRGQIEQLDAQRVALADQVAYGTLETTFGLEVVAVQQAAKGWDPATEVDRAGATLVSVLQAVATAGIWLVIVWLPILVVLAVVIVAGRLVLRRLGFPRPRPPVQGWQPPA
jgi:hypothetical protein